jgi:hypothetical protein
MSAGPLAHLPGAAPTLAAEARGSTSSTTATMPLPSRSGDETDRSRGQADAELPAARKGGRTRHVRTVCGGNVARVRSRRLHLSVSSSAVSSASASPDLATLDPLRLGPPRRPAGSPAGHEQTLRLTDPFTRAETRSPDRVSLTISFTGRCCPIPKPGSDARREALLLPARMDRSLRPIDFERRHPRVIRPVPEASSFTTRAPAAGALAAQAA